MSRDYFRRNASGYVDPTAHKAINNLNTDEQIRHKRVMKKIFEICECNGLEVNGRIVLKDKKSGRVWK